MACHCWARLGFNPAPKRTHTRTHMYAHKHARTWVLMRCISTPPCLYCCLAPPRVVSCSRWTKTGWTAAGARRMCDGAGPLTPLSAVCRGTFHPASRYCSLHSSNRTHVHTSECVCVCLRVLFSFHFARTRARTSAFSPSPSSSFPNFGCWHDVFAPRTCGVWGCCGISF